MKGLELPISTIIIIVIVLIVLLSITALFFGVYSPGSESTTLQTATSATCMRVNPTICEDTGPNRMLAARTPIYNFDANKNGKINDFHQDGQWSTTYCIDDNLETLCGFYYGCKINPCPSGAILITEPGGNFDPSDASNANMVTNDDWIEWHKCCVKKVCGCP